MHYVGVEKSPCCGRSLLGVSVGSQKLKGGKKKPLKREMITNAFQKGDNRFDNMKVTLHNLLMETANLLGDNRGERKAS